MVTDYIREYVKTECYKETFTRELYDNHIVVVAEFGAKLAKILNADFQVVQLAAYLHDFSSVHNFELLNEHRVKEAKVADELLQQFNYSENIINQVKDTILKHSKPQNKKQLTAEAICLFNADAMSQLAKPLFWLYFGYTIKKRSYKECIEIYTKWMEDNWKNMIEPAREMMMEEYEFIKKLK